MQKQKTMTILRIVLICIFATVFVVSAVMLVSTLLDYRAASELYGEVHDDFMNAINQTTGDPDDNTAADIWTRGPEGVVVAPTTNPPMSSDVTTPPAATTPPTGDSGPSQTTTPAETQPPAPVYSEKFLNACKFINELKEQNPQVVGYIYVELDPADESKNISYPLLRTDDNSYYIDHAYDNSELRAGAIFMDYRNSTDLYRNTATVVYGHNMNNGAMFHNLKYLKQKDYFDRATVTIYTLNAIYTYKPFAIYNTTSDSGYARMYFDSDEHFLSFVNDLQRKSLVSSNMEFYSTDRIITLSTCLNTSASARMAVHAVLVGVSQ